MQPGRDPMETRRRKGELHGIRRVLLNTFRYVSQNRWGLATCVLGGGPSLPCAALLLFAVLSLHEDPSHLHLCVLHPALSLSRP